MMMTVYPSESEENFTSASETCGYYAERSSATLTCDDYTERAKADLLSLVGNETSKRKGPSQTSKSRKRTREGDTGHQGSTSSKLREAWYRLTRVINLMMKILR